MDKDNGLKPSQKGFRAPYTVLGYLNPKINFQSHLLKSELNFWKRGVQMTRKIFVPNLVILWSRIYDLLTSFFLYDFFFFYKKRLR